MKLNWRDTSIELPELVNTYVDGKQSEQVLIVLKPDQIIVTACLYRMPGYDDIWLQTDDIDFALDDVAYWLPFGELPLPQKCAEDLLQESRK